MGYLQLLKNIKQDLIENQQRENIFYLDQNKYSTDEINNIEKRLKKIDSNIINKILSGTAVLNNYGKTYKIAYEINTNLNAISFEKTNKKLLEAFYLIKGIRYYTQEKLQNKGYRKIDDLISHPRFSYQAKSILNYIKEKNFQKLKNIFESRISKTHPLFFLLLSFLSSEEFLFIDLETLGLYSGNIVILAGIIKPISNDKVNFYQFLLQSPKQESALLEEITKLFKKAKIIITFNGKSFDIPFLEYRLSYYGLPLPKIEFHLDLLHFARRNWGEILSDCSLTTIEDKILKTERKFDISSSLVPYFYKKYLSTRNKIYLFPIILHNRNDLISLLRLLNYFIKNDCFN
jgi:hypothetical protein